MTCFILFSSNYANNEGNIRSNWRYDDVGYEYISKIPNTTDWFSDTIYDNFNSSEWAEVRRLFK